MKKASILIAHNHEIYVSGLAHEIGNNTRVTYIARDGERPLRWLLKKKPALAIVDAELIKISAFGIIRTAREQKISTKFIVIFSKAEEQFVRVEKHLRWKEHSL